MQEETESRHRKTATGKRKRTQQTATTTDQEKVKTTITFDEANAIVQDQQFWEQGKCVMKLLAPILKEIGLLEKDGCSVSMVYQTSVDLPNDPLYYNPQDLIDTAVEVRSLIKNRWNFLHTDTMGIAFRSDPTKNPDDFVGDDCEKALKDISVVAKRLGYSEEMQSAAFREANVS